MPRRPSPRRSGAVARLLPLVPVALLAAGCSGPVALDAPDLSGSERGVCARLVDHLPRHVADQPRREADAGHGYGAAWGDPAIELRCGVGRPAGLDRYATCQNANGVDWYIPSAQQSGTPSEVTMTTVGRSTYVEVRIPRDYLPPAAAMVDLARAVKRNVPEVRPCL